MHTKIQELEREIDLFHKNIKESNELLSLLKSVVSLTKKQADTFEIEARRLYDKLDNLSPDLRELFKEKTGKFVEEFHEEHLSYQAAISEIMEKYDKKIAHSRSIIENAHKELDLHLHESLKKHVDILKLVQERYAANLEKANDEHSRLVHSLFEEIQSIPRYIREDAARQHSAFLEKFENLLKNQLKLLAETEGRLLELQQDFESKYLDFLSRLESTDIDRLSKYLISANKSINTKLGILFGGIILVIIVSFISLFS